MIGASLAAVAPFDVGVKVNGLEIGRVKPRHVGFSLRVRRH